MRAWQRGLEPAPCPAAISGSSRETGPFLGLGGEVPTSVNSPLCALRLCALPQVRIDGDGAAPEVWSRGRGGFRQPTTGRLFGKGAAPVVEQAEKLIQSNPPRLWHPASPAFLCSALVCSRRGAWSSRRAPALSATWPRASAAKLEGVEGLGPKGCSADFRSREQKSRKGQGSGSLAAPPLPGSAQRLEGKVPRDGVRFLRLLAGCLFKESKTVILSMPRLDKELKPDEMSALQEIGKPIHHFLLGRLVV